jgi:excinuclease UvrABC ATPase subunit
MIRHLGSSLTDVTYVFDELTIGLHPTTSSG